MIEYATATDATTMDTNNMDTTITNGVPVVTNNKDTATESITNVMDVFINNTVTTDSVTKGMTMYYIFMTTLLDAFFFILAASEVNSSSISVMYRVALGICLSLIAILLLVVMILTAYATRLCSHRFKRRTHRPGERNFIL